MDRKKLDERPPELLGIEPLKKRTPYIGVNGFRGSSIRHNSYSHSRKGAAHAGELELEVSREVSSASSLTQQRRANRSRIIDRPSGLSPGTLGALYGIARSSTPPSEKVMPSDMRPNVNASPSKSAFAFEAPDSPQYRRIDPAQNPYKRKTP